MSQALSVDEVDEESLTTSKYLTFVLGSETYGLDIQYVREIIGILPITPLPDVPVWIKGVINLRGKVIPIMDVRARFMLEERPYGGRTCIIVVNVEEWWIGLVVDTVSEVLDIPHEQIEPPPRVAGRSNDHFIQGLGKVDDHVRLLLDAQRLVGSDEVSSANRTANELDESSNHQDRGNE
ncbi:MAG: chemotaxis protein CheW [Myxococcota bacterium]